MLKHKDLLTLFAKFDSVVVLRESSIEFCYSRNAIMLYFAIPVSVIFNFAVA